MFGNRDVVISHAIGLVVYQYMYNMHVHGPFGLVEKMLQVVVAPLCY